MSLRFSKMHSLGNDFVVLDGVRQSIQLTPELARHIADRRQGIGCDQILIAENDPEGNADFLFRIYNSDGSESGQCGNGARCFAKFLRDNNLTENNEVTVNTSSNTLMTLYTNTDESVTVDMGAPEFRPSRIPFEVSQINSTYPIEIDNEILDFGVVSMGNPHAVLLVDSVDTARVAEIGPQIENHARFPERTNVGFMQVLNSGEIRLRVHERGAGETQACGSGSCAAVVSGIQRGLLDETVSVNLPGGKLTVSYAGGQNKVFLRGDAIHVYDGQLG